MARIYYTALKVEYKQPLGGPLKAGLILKVAKCENGLVECTILYEDLHNHMVGGQKHYLEPELCRKIMLRPSVDLANVIEQSIMISEATYC